MNYKHISLYLIIALIILMIITWNNPDWQIQVPAVYFFTLIFILALIDIGAFEGLFRSLSPGYLSDIDDKHSHASINHKDIIDFIDPMFSTRENPKARFTCAVLNGLDYGIVSVRGRGPIQFFPSVYLRNRNDGYVNDGQFELWNYDELTPKQQETLEKFSKIRTSVKKDKINIWVSTVSNLDGSNTKSNLDHTQALQQANKERNALKGDYERSLDYVRGKKVLTRKGFKDKTTYEEKEE